MNVGYQDSLRDVRVLGEPIGVVGLPHEDASLPQPRRPLRVLTLQFLPIGAQRGTGSSVELMELETPAGSAKAIRLAV
jgi:hypothetical protein